MKTKAIYCREHTRMPQVPYPNAATPTQVLHKFLDTLIVAASGAGLAAILLLALAFF